MLTFLYGPIVAIHLLTSQAFNANLDVTIAASAATRIAWTHIVVKSGDS